VKVAVRRVHDMQMERIKTTFVGIICAMFASEEDDVNTGILTQMKLAI
jgi:hypothetical protein